VIVKRLDYGSARAFLRRSCFEHVTAKNVARNSDQEPQQKWNAPAPGVERSDLKVAGAKTTLANAGIGSASHLCGMLLMSQLQVTLTTVPYRGTGPVMNDLLGKQVDMTCDQATDTTGPILSKQVKAYAITTKTRLPSLPDLATADEAGLKGFELAVWHGVSAPRGTPPVIMQKLSAALIGALKDPDLVKRFREISTDPMPADKATPQPRSARSQTRSTAGRRSSKRPANTWISYTCPRRARPAFWWSSGSLRYAIIDDTRWV
jgi:Tripartite tricarboxylate transporter family receptor